MNFRRYFRLNAQKALFLCHIINLYINFKLILADFDDAISNSFSNNQNDSLKPTGQFQIYD